MLTMLVLYSQVPSLLTLDGRPVGEAADGLPLPLCDGAHYLGALPLVSGFCPVTRRLWVEGGAVEREPDVGLRLWSDCAEVLLPAMALPVPETAALLDEKPFAGGRALLFRQGGLHLSIEKDGETLWSQTLAPGGSGRLEVAEDYLLAFPEAGCLCLRQEPSGLVETLSFSDGICSLTDEGRLRRELLQDTCLRHRQVEEYAPAGQRLLFSAAPTRRAADGRQAALAFCDALRLGLFEELPALAEASLCDLGAPALREFLGPFAQALPHPFLRERLGLLSGETVRAFSFEAEERAEGWYLLNLSPVPQEA